MKRFYIQFVILCQVFALIPGPVTVQARPIPHTTYVYKKLPELPQTDFEPVSELPTIPTPLTSVPDPSPVLPLPADACGDNSYANYIYMHESGCRTHNPNSSGCDGIGQACPASKVIDQCGYDYSCQNAWFTDYAASAYGGWAGAYDFWLQHHWW